MKWLDIFPMLALHLSYKVERSFILFLGERCIVLGSNVGYIESQMIKLQRPM